jgi:hypothetical protein
LFYSINNSWITTKVSVTLIKTEIHTSKHCQKYRYTSSATQKKPRNSQNIPTWHRYTFAFFFSSKQNLKISLLPITYIIFFKINVLIVVTFIRLLIINIQWQKVVSCKNVRTGVTRFSWVAEDILVTRWRHARVGSKLVA